jgi:tagatose 1,6-diphosphate aldolase GatY/KbaY
VPFLERSGADLLAVSVGNVHGPYSSAPHLDWSRLAAIRAATDVPLVLHGASGLASADRDCAVLAGVCKFNINTELRQTVFDAMSDAVDVERHRGLDLNSLLGTWRSAVALRAFTAIGDLTSNGASA